MVHPGNGRGFGLKRLLSKLPPKEAAMQVHTAGRKQGMPHRMERSKISRMRSYALCLMISSVTFLASPKSIIVLGRKNSSFSTPA
jgi:hypothetical protein